MTLVDLTATNPDGHGTTARLPKQPYEEYGMTQNPCILNIEAHCPPDTDEVCAASGITKANAEAACGNVVPCGGATSVVDDCAYDVCLTGDLDVAGSYEEGNPIDCELQRPESSTLCGATADPNSNIAVSKAAMEATGWSFDWDDDRVSAHTLV